MQIASPIVRQPSATPTGNQTPRNCYQLGGKSTAVKKLRSPWLAKLDAGSHGCAKEISFIHVGGNAQAKTMNGNQQAQENSKSQNAPPLPHAAS